MELKDIFSKRLRNARLMRGLSMQQLCVMMNDIVTKQSVSKYERGESMPDSTILIALCKALNISPDYLFRENRSALNNVHYRKLTRLSAKEEKSINLMVEDTIERINEIEDICGIERHFDASSFTCQVKSLNDVFSAATKLRTDWNIGNAAITNVINILETNGIIVVEVEASDAFSGLNGTLENGTPVIVINKQMSTDRKRFTALHELGHALLHFPEDMDEKMEEQYCNIFANEVLMPRQTFLQSIGEKRHDIALVELKNLQSEFGISVDALMYKARYLDVISENRYTTYWKKKNFDSNFKSQVEKSIIDDEHSTRFENLIYRALSSGLITESKAAVLLNKTTEEVWRYYIGGYQIAEKWLKDRKGTELDFNAIIHYSNILYVLAHNEPLAGGH